MAVRTGCSCEGMDVDMNMGMDVDVDMDMDAYWLVSWAELGRGLKDASECDMSVKDGCRLPSTRKGKGDGRAYWVLM